MSSLLSVRVKIKNRASLWLWPLTLVFLLTIVLVDVADPGPRKDGAVILSATLNDDGSVVIDGEGLVNKHRPETDHLLFVTLGGTNVESPGFQKLTVVEQIETGSGTRLIAEFPIPGVLPAPGTYRLTVANKRGEAHIAFTIPALVIRTGSIIVPPKGDELTLEVSCPTAKRVVMFETSTTREQTRGVECRSDLKPPGVECRIDNSNTGGDIEVKKRVDHTNTGGDIEVKRNRLTLSVLCAR